MRGGERVGATALDLGARVPAEASYMAAARVQDGCYCCRGRCGSEEMQLPRAAGPGESVLPVGELAGRCSSGTSRRGSDPVVI